jgi:2-aminoethylphosphonate-pyruvate transaminase
VKAVILAAGVGNRLGETGEGRPKCLLEIGGKTLVQRMLERLTSSGVSPVVIVVGFQKEQIQEHVRSQFPSAQVQFVANKDFRRGSIVSLWSARDHLDDDFLLMDADVLFHPEILSRLVQTRHANTFLIDRKFADDGEAMIAAARDGRMVAFERGLAAPCDFCGESVGFFGIAKTTVPALLQAIRPYIDRGELDAHYEFALRDLLAVLPFGYEDISGLPWTEIDFPEDVDRARNEVLPLIETDLPTRRCILLNPGPGNTTETVRSAAALLPDLCHREKEFFHVLRYVREELVKIAGADPSTYSTVVFTGSGTAAVEAMICSAVPEGRKILIVDNGVYGDRMVKMAEAHRILAHRLRYDWSQAARPADIDQVLAQDSGISHVAVVHHETTTGLLNPIHDIGQAVRKHRRSLIVDAMSSFAGEALNVVEDNVDFAASSANKCLQGLAGLSFAICRRECLEALASIRPRSVYLDLHNQWRQEEADNTPFTPAIQVFYSLKQAIAELHEETLEGRIRRYADCARTLRDGMQALGFRILVPEPYRSDLLTTFLLPKGLTYDPLHDAMKRRGYIIYAGQSDLKKIAFRIANLGTLRPRDMQSVVVAIRDSLRESGVDKVVYE